MQNILIIWQSVRMMLLPIMPSVRISVISVGISVRVSDRTKTIQNQVLVFLGLALLLRCLWLLFA